MTSDAITITGSNNTILLKGDADTVSVLRGSGNRITLSVTVGTMVLAGKNTTVDGTGKIGTVDTRMVGCTVTAKADHTIDNIDPGLDGVQITMTVPDKVKGRLADCQGQLLRRKGRRYLHCNLVSGRLRDQGLHEQQLRADQRQDLQPHQHFHLHQEYEDQHGDWL